MAFNPDAYLAEKAPSDAFNPDAYLEAKGEAPGSSISQLESALRGGAQGASFGFAPAITGALEAIPEALHGKDLMESYRTKRDETNELYKQAQEANPYSYLAGEVAGGVAPALLAPQASALKLGAGMGALSGLGQSVSGGQDLGDTAANVATQGVMGGAIGGALGKLSSALAPEALKKSAAKNAVEAFHPSKSEVAKMMKSPALEKGANRLEEVGANLLKKTPYGETPIVTPFANAEQRAAKLDGMLQAAGKDVGEIINDIDKNVKVNNDFFKPSDLVQEIENVRKNYIIEGLPGESSQTEYNALSGLMRDIQRFGNEPVDFKTANKIKKIISDKAYNQQGSVIDQDYAALRGFVNNKIDESLDKVAGQLADPAQVQKYGQAKDLYRTAKQLEKSAAGELASGISNRDLGLTDYISAGVGHAVGGTPGAAALAVGNKLARKNYNTVMAVGQDKLADGLSKAAKAFAKYKPVDFKSIGSTFMTSQDPIKKRLGSALVAASQKDQIGRNAVVFSILQNPDYRDIINSIVTSGDAK